MWGFQNIKNSVQSHAAGLFRNISDKMGGEYEEAVTSDAGEKVPPKDAMKNVVTPGSIPKFTLPPLLTYDSPPPSPTNLPTTMDAHLFNTTAASKCLKVGNDRLFKHGKKVLPSEEKNYLYNMENVTNETENRNSTERHNRTGNDSLSSLSIKSIVHRKKSNDRKTANSRPDESAWQEEKLPDKARVTHQSPCIRESGGKTQRPEQPGLSLHHLLSTKAGFSTLSESPTTKRKESLFLSDDSPQICDCADASSKSDNRFETTRPFSSNQAQMVQGARRRCKTRISKSNEKRPTGHRSLEIPNSEPENSDSDASIASYTDAKNNSARMHRIRSRRIFGRGLSPECDSNNSSAYSTPQGSPAVSPRNSSQHRGRQRFRASKQASECDEYRQRRLSLEEDSNSLLYASNSEGHLLSINTENRRLCSSAHNVNRLLDDDALLLVEPQQSSIRVCLTYLVQHKRLNVSILEGKNFVAGRTVYLKVTLLPRHDRGHRTEPMKIQSSNLDIRERLTFDAVHERDIPHMSLKICCKEKSSRLRHAAILGECILALCDINFKASNDLWVSFRPYEEEEAPHIQLSLCYDAMLGCLTVDVVGARNVPKGSLGRQPDCFVTLTEMLPNTKVAKKQTKVAHRSQDPVFQESFLFSMCADAPDELVIVATLFAKDRVRGTVEAMGEAKIGQLVDSWTGRSQWAQALANEGEPITHWHTLETTHA